jgi:hypothetical protein
MHQQAALLHQQFFAGSMTVLGQQALVTTLQPCGLPVLTMPFCIIALPFVILQKERPRWSLRCLSPEDHLHGIHIGGSFSCSRLQDSQREGRIGCVAEGERWQRRHCIDLKKQRIHQNIFPLSFDIAAALEQFGKPVLCHLDRQRLSQATDLLLDDDDGIDVVKLTNFVTVAKVKMFVDKHHHVVRETDGELTIIAENRVMRGELAEPTIPESRITGESQDRPLSLLFVLL